MRPMRALCLLSILTALTLTIRVAHADPARMNMARKHYKQGKLDYKAGKFSRALKEFEAGLKLAKRPSFYFNIAQCFRKLDKPRDSLDHYRLYLAAWRDKHLDQPAPSLAEVKKHIKELEARLKATDTPDEPGRSDLVVVPAQQDPAPPRSQPFYKKWWFWTGVSVVVVGATTAAIFASQPGVADPYPGSLGTVLIP